MNDCSKTKGAVCFIIDKLVFLMALGIIGGGIACAGFMVQKGLLEFRSDERVVTVKGLSEKDVKADLALLPLSYAETGDDLSVLQASMEEKGQKIVSFLKGFGIEDGEISLEKIEVQDLLAQSYRSTNVSTNRFITTQGYLVRTDKIDTIEKINRSIGDLIKDGVAFTRESGQPIYLFTRLNDVKPGMIAEATKNARATAEQFAADSGEDVGGIKKASQGVFQILPRDNTRMVREESQINKKLRVVSTIEFYLD